MNKIDGISKGKNENQLLKKILFVPLILLAVIELIVASVLFIWDILSAMADMYWIELKNKNLEKVETDCVKKD